MESQRKPSESSFATVSMVHEQSLNALLLVHIVGELIVLFKLKDTVHTTQGACMHCIELTKHKIPWFFHDQMQERNTEEHQERIQVYPCIVLSCDKHRY